MIVDLGSNIGTTVADFAQKFPNARVVGVELDSDNLRLCLNNVAPWKDRCSVLQGAVSDTDGYCTYDRRADSNAFTITCGSSVSEGTTMQTVKAFSLNRIFSDHLSQQPVDYLKMDIEGAEKQVLRSNTEWAQAVRCLKVELHGDYTPEDCLHDLTVLGFHARLDRKHPHCIVGVRRPSKH